jgi:hypothetical protein
MRIEQWHLNHKPENPAYKLLMKLRSWCEQQGLSPKTVKVITHLREIPQYTALGARMGISPNTSYLTIQEKNLIDYLSENKEISNTSILLIIDVDGVLVSIWPAICNFWEKWKNSPTFSLHKILRSLEESIVQTRPPWWDTLLPLARIAKPADQIIIWTNRVPVNQDSIFWRVISGIFNDKTWLEKFPFFSHQTAEKLKNANCFRGKTQVMCGFPKRIFPIIQKIKEMGDPYVVYIGSSLIDINNFKKIIRRLQREEMPFDRIVFCSTNHLIL